MGPEGSSDIIGILPDGKFIGIECKRPGQKATDVQKNFLRTISENHGVAFVATSIEDVQSELDAYFSGFSYKPYHER